jgi:hypothetical protein
MLAHVMLAMTTLSIHFHELCNTLRFQTKAWNANKTHDEEEGLERIFIFVTHYANMEMHHNQSLENQ